MAVIKNYTFSKSVIYAIQAITGEKTHTIISTLAAKGDEIIEKNKLQTNWTMNACYSDVNSSTREYLYYPNTKFYIGIYVNISKNDVYNYDHGNEYLTFVHIKYNVKLPQSMIHLTEQEYENLAVDGLLTDFSEDLEEPKIKTKNKAT